MKKEFQLNLPHNAEAKDVTLNQNLVIVGANGSGKTRLGTWIEMESLQKAKVHRISAQKSLSMPDSSSPMSLEKAISSLLYGHQEANESNGFQYKSGHRWGGKPAISLLSDFERLMVFLFSEDYEQRNQFRQKAKLSNKKVTPPETKIDIVKRIWEEILPHRELTVGSGTVKTNVKGAGNTSYNASEMSDGERVIFYLIGQCLAAPSNGIIVIDEPELHLHKSIQVALWNALELHRSDCIFVYITHDVDFAASMESSVKIWLKSFNGTQWEWEVIEQIDGMPEDLLLEVIGSRKPVVFVEGENGSLDVALYRALLKRFLVIPVGGCSQVIQSVKALKKNKQLHHFEIYGLIDRDRRVNEELIELEKSCIFALTVAEVENLFCTHEVLEVVAKILKKDAAEVINAASDFIFKKINSELETQVSLRCASEVKFNLNSFDEKAKGALALENALNSLTTTINIPTIYADIELAINEAINNKDYKAVLRLYNRKSLASQIGSVLGFKDSEFPELVIRFAKSSDAKEIALALKPYFGNFSKYISL